MDITDALFGKYYWDLQMTKTQSDLVMSSQMAKKRGVIRDPRTTELNHILMPDKKGENSNNSRLRP